MLIEREKDRPVSAFGGSVGLRRPALSVPQEGRFISSQEGMRCIP